MPRIIAVIPIDLERSRLGLPSLAAHALSGKPVLRHVVDRVARVTELAKILLVHPMGQEPLALLGDSAAKVATLADPGNLLDPYHAMRTAARKWGLASWRGGPGGMTCYDELLPARPILEAMKLHNADAALIVGGDWALVDPVWCQRVVDLHDEFPEAMQMTFTQAPPGLAGVVVGIKLVTQLAENPSGTIGQIVGYVPTRPQADPIGRDVCVQMPGPIRSCARRFIYDTPRSAAMIDAIADRLGDGFDTADAAAVTETLYELERAIFSSPSPLGEAGRGTESPSASEEPPSQPPPEGRGKKLQPPPRGKLHAGGFANLPQQVTLELTPRRLATGPLVPQHYVDVARDDIDLDAALRVVKQLGASGDVALTLGGLGDALLHPHWDKIVETAHDAGVMGICVETDLIVAKGTLDRLIELPIDVISVRLNGDRAAEYHRLMGVDRFSNVIGGLQYLFEQRAKRADVAARPSVPWMVVRLLKTTETLEDMESFFDKWTHYLGHAVIEPATSGCGLMPELSPVRMEPPRRRACRQLDGRMTVLSDGRVARCDQDWLGRGAAGDATKVELPIIWDSMEELRAAHRAGRWSEVELCGSCREWHRP